MFSTHWPARAAGMEALPSVAFDLGIDELLAASRSARDFLDGLTPDMFEGRDEELIQQRITEELEPTLPAAQWLTNFSNTNFFFHLSIAYAILRAHGVPLGKQDMFAAGL